MRNCLLTACLVALPLTANSALLERLGGLAYYDEDADLTWLANANAAGAMNWDVANTWAAGLDVAGVTGWRLPDTLQPDASCDNQSGGYSLAYNCTGSEMGNLFYNTLGNNAFLLSNTGPFSNVQSSYYWATPEYAASTDNAWGFNMGDGDQGYNFKTNGLYAWAVHDGDVSTIPIPAAIWLFGSGLFGLIGLARRKA